ncbi:MAG: DUF5610 domain-containing protein [Colwellia sp.]|nr:DUF5610 domain-containing protein [Colwellia sp.]
MHIQPHTQDTIASTQPNSAESVKPNVSAYQQSKKMQDLAILTAVSNNSVADNPMDLLYKTAIEEINKVLEPIFGKNAAQAAYESNVDFSPEATAQRIVQGSAAFYEAFKQQNSELDDEESLNEFINVISSGIDKGFEEAKGILGSLSVLEGDIESNIDLTYGFVQQGLVNFKEQFLASLAESDNSKIETIAN